MMMMKSVVALVAFIQITSAFACFDTLGDAFGQERRGRKCLSEELTDLVQENIPGKTANVHVLTWADGEVEYYIHTNASDTGLIKATLKARSNYRALAKKVCSEKGFSEVVILKTDTGNTRYQQTIQCQVHGGCSTAFYVKFSCSN